MHIDSLLRIQKKVFDFKSMREIPYSHEHLAHPAILARNIVLANTIKWYTWIDR